MNQQEINKLIQEAMNKKGESLKVDGDFGPNTQAAASKYNFSIEAIKIQLDQIVQDARKTPPWKIFSLKFKGKNENDPAFNKEMSEQWKLFDMDLGTIAKSWAAWCGLAMAVALTGVSVDYQKNGQLARNWATYAIEVDWKNDGIPEGAIVQTNHVKCGSESSNHVAQANGDCAASDLIEMKKVTKKDKDGKPYDVYVPEVRANANIDLYGGNQGNTWKVSTYSAKEICAVRWPKGVKDYPKPDPILKSVNCSSKNKDNESTR